MKRIIRFFLSFGLALGACGHAAAPQIIENALPERAHTASVQSNVAAYVWVYCFWKSPSDTNPDSNTTWDINNGIVLDEYHILSTHCADEKEANNWEDGYLDQLTIGPPDANNQSGIGPWQAKLTAEDNSGTDLVVLTTDVQLPLPSVVPADKTPEIGDLLYTITAIPGDAGLSNVDLFMVNATKYLADPFTTETSPQPDFAVLVPGKGSVPSPLGIFNQNDDFVGFVLDGSMSPAAIPLHAPEEFKTTLSMTSAYDILWIRGPILKSLLHKAGVSWSY